MAVLRKVLFVFVLVVVTLEVQGSDSKFCIRFIENKDDQQCEVAATILTLKEKDIFYRTMCKEHVKNIKGDYSYLRILNGALEDRQSYHSLCQEQEPATLPLLAWLPWQTVKDRIVGTLNKTEINFYIGKATNEEKSNTELCFFSQASMLSNEVSCRLLIFEDDVFGADSDIQVLVEILPVFYEIRNITYEPWTKIKHSYKAVLGKSILKNPSDEKATVYGHINYGFIEKIKLDTSTFTNKSLGKLPILFEHEDSFIKLLNGSGTIEHREKSYFGRLLDSKSSTKVDLIGQWSEHHLEFRGDLYENFGHGIRHFKMPLKSTNITCIKISAIEPVYENIEKVHVFKRNDEVSARLTQGGLGQNVTAVVSKSQLGKKSNHPYPGFFPYFIVGSLIVGSALVITIGRMILILKREGKF